MSYRDFLQSRGCCRFPELCRIAAALSMAVAPGAIAQPAAEDARDMAIIVPALNSALENERSGKEVPWSNAETGRSGMIRIERTFYRGQQPCRDYRRTTIGGGADYEVRGVGCRLGKVNWGFEETRLVNPTANPKSSAPMAPMIDPTAKSAADPAAKSAADSSAKSAGSPADPAASAARTATTRASDPSGDPTSPRSLRKPAPAPPSDLRYSLPTRTQP
jgi:surface antigen